jgi:hypothetical protein
LAPSAKPSADAIAEDVPRASSFSDKRDLAAAYYSRGLAYQSKGDLDRAIADFTKAIELGSDVSDERHNPSVASAAGPAKVLEPAELRSQIEERRKELADLRDQVGRGAVSTDRDGPVTIRAKRPTADERSPFPFFGGDGRSQTALVVEGGTRFGDQHVLTVGLPGKKTKIGFVTSAFVDPQGSGHMKVIVPQGSVDFGNYNSLGSDGHAGLLFTVGNNPKSSESSTTFIPAMRIHAPHGGESPRVTVNEAADDGTSALQVKGKTSLDGGLVTTDGLGTLCLHPQDTPPKAVQGGIYFDGSSFFFCTDGETWKPVRLR